MPDDIIHGQKTAADLPPLPDGWEYSSLADLVEPNGLSYGIVQPGSDTPGGVPIVRVKNLRKNQIEASDVLRVSENIAAKYSRTRLVGGEVLLSLVGSVGEVALAPPSLAGWNVARAIAVIRTRGNINTWLSYYLSSELAQKLMDLWQTTTVQATLNLRDVKRIPVAMPPESTRDAFISLLTALDDKIAVNNRIIRECDQLRRLYLEYWIESNPALTDKRPLSSVAEFINGRAFTKGATGNGRMVIRIAEINSGPSGSTVFNDIEVPEAHLARPGDVLFAWSGSLTVTRWFRPEAIINQHIFKVIPRDGLPVWLTFELIQKKLAAFRAIAAGKATTMGHIQRHHLDEPVTVPVWQYLATLDLELGPLWQRALAAEQESLKLAELRNTLLPRLMSGGIRLKNAEHAVEEVT